MQTEALTGQKQKNLASAPWLWGARTDVGVFFGSAAFALALVVIRRALGLNGDLPEWAFVALVIAVDVAHVYATLFRTYFDRHELARHPQRYALVPLVAYVAGVSLYIAGGSAWFWRGLAYTALFHFVRQQIGWAALYRARAGESSAIDKLVDDAALYSATLFPVLVWHTRLGDSNFSWFIQGDFVDLSFATNLVAPARVLWSTCLVVFAARQVQLALVTGTIHLGKIIVVSTTALTWYVGIVATNSDFDFTVTNVVVHGVPYAALIWSYARARSEIAPDVVSSRIVAGGFATFLGVLLLFAFVEEMAWDRFVFADRPWLFGAGPGPLSASVSRWIVPLLAVPQATHYFLDGVLWRRRDTAENAAQRRLMGAPTGHLAGSETGCAGMPVERSQ